MEPIFPLTEEHLDRFRGQLVCVVMKDGTRHVGILGHCRSGKLVLNEGEDAAHGDIAGQQSEPKGKRRGRNRPGSRKGGKPEAQAAGFGGEWFGPPAFVEGPYWPPYGPYGFFGPRLALDLALIALVLLIL